MSYFDDIYTQRVNRYGTTYTSRIQGKREDEFAHYLLKSVYKVSFVYNNNTVEGSLERYKQDDTQTLQYLLTTRNLIIPNGTILNINNTNWMIYYLENIKASGYNRYIVLKMTHYLSWTKNSVTYNTYAYLCGKQSSELRNTIKSKSDGTVYMENMNCDFFIIPRNSNISKGDYLEVGTAPFQDYYRVTGYDFQSSEGIEFVTIDHVYKYDLTAAPSRQSGDTDEEFYWLDHGVQ